MSRVKEQDNKRMETERMQKQSAQADRKSKLDGSSREQFKSLLQQGDHAQRNQRDTQGKLKQSKQGEQLKKMAKGLKQNALKNTRLARQGSSNTSRALDQAQNYHALLDKNQASAGKTAAQLATEGKESVLENHEAASTRNADIDTKSENKKDVATQQAKLDAAKKGQANAAIDTDTQSGDQQPGQNDEAGVDAAKRAQKGGAAAEEVSKSGRTTEIPEEVMEALVKEIFLGVDVDGISMFHIELKEGVLGGGSMQVKSDGGKVRLSFKGLDKNAQNLVESSQGKLMRRLESKGLQLDQLSFG